MVKCIGINDQAKSELLVSYAIIINKKQKETKEQKWLINHCTEYGFILRCSVFKRGYTHVNHEPWHYRYVGKDNALEIMDKGICLVEYLNSAKYKKKC